MADGMPTGLPFDEYRVAIVRAASEPAADWHAQAREIARLAELAETKSREAIDHQRLAEARGHDAVDGRGTVADRLRQVGGGGVVGAVACGLALGHASVGGVEPAAAGAVVGAALAAAWAFGPRRTPPA